MTKQELADQVAVETNLPRRQAAEAVDKVIEVITRTLSGGGKVQLAGFGTFEVRMRKPRRGRNLQTGEIIDIPGGKAPAFKAGKKLKEAVA